jgi:hypothetical protein
MDQDHEAEATRREELDRTRDVGKPEVGRNMTPKQIDPERLSKAIRYRKEHPEPQAGRFQARIFDFLRHT